MEQQMLFTYSTMHAAEDRQHRHDDHKDAHAGRPPNVSSSRGAIVIELHCMQTYQSSSETETTTRPPTATKAAE
jgi:hypothetical protein